MSDMEDFLNETLLEKKIKMKPKKKNGVKQKNAMTEKPDKKRRKKDKCSQLKMGTEWSKVKKKKNKRKGGLDGGEKKKKKKMKELDGGLFDSAASSLHPNKTVKPKKRKSKKKVLFNLSPGRIHIKRPKLPPLRGEEMEEWVEMGEDNDSPSSNVHSQDLFITQKTCRESPPRTASRTEMFPEEPHSFFSRLGPNRWASPEVSNQRTEEQTSLQGRRRHNQKVPTEGESRTNCPNDRWVSSPRVTPFLDGLLAVESSRRDSSTQTENFFTSEFLSCRGSAHRVGASVEKLQPLDLSLPHRVRAHQRGRCKTEVEPRPVHDPLSKRGATGQWAESTGGGDSTLSPQSQCEPKSGDANTSSEDGEVDGRIGIMTQVRTVQMRLNESFFFKTKGDARSPRPESPLMKLAHGREVKHRKSR